MRIFEQIIYKLRMKQYLQSGELIENQSEQIGLFTFYKQQEGEEDSRQRMPFGFCNKINPLGSANFKQEQSRLNKSVNCEEFLRNIRVKQPQGSILKEAKEKRGQKEAQSQSQIKTNKQMIVNKKKNESYNLFLGRTNTKSFKKFVQVSGIDEVQPISAEIIRKKYFNSQRQTVAVDCITKTEPKERLKDRSIGKRQMLRCKQQQEALICRTFLVDHQQKDSIRIRLRQYKEKSKDDDKVSRKRLQSNRDTGIIKRTSINKNMHQKNKMYFNQLMENMSFQPQNNQTAYKILRETLKLPQFNANSQERIKTEGNSPKRKHFPINSYYYNSKISIKSKQSDLYSKNALKRIIGNRLIFRKPSQK